MKHEREHDPLRESFSGKKVLITGGAGYLASALISRLRETDCHLVRLDRESASFEPVPGRARVTDLAGDVQAPAVWERALEGVDYVFHLAAQTSTYAANADPVADLAINVKPMLYLLECCRRQGLSPTICFSSTATIVGLPERLPVDETHPDRPVTVYDLHKQMAEQYLRYYAEQGWVRGVTLRLANVYGPGPRSSSSDRGVLNQMIRRALRGEELTVYGTGRQLRDYVFIEDVAGAFLAAAQHAEELNGGHYVVGTGQGHTIAGAMEMIAERAAARSGIEAPVRHITPPDSLSPIEVRNFVADSRRFTQATGWKACHTLAEGIDRTMEAFS